MPSNPSLDRTSPEGRSCGDADQYGAVGQDDDEEHTIQLPGKENNDGALEEITSISSYFNFQTPTSHLSQSKNSYREDKTGEMKVESKEEEEGEGKKKEEEEKTDEKKKVVSSSRNLWISGLSSTTRATDLKVVFSKWGKVVGAKVVTNARTPGARCYGYVTMNSSEDASACIKNLNRTELHGKMITVERAKVESSSSGSGSKAGGSSKDKETEKKEGSSSKEGGSNNKEEGGSKSERQRITGPGGDNRKSGDRSSRPSTSSSNKSPHHGNGHGGPRRDDKGRHGGGVLTFNQIWDQRKRELEKEEERR